MRLVPQLFRRFRDHDIIRISGSIAFQLILSLVPALLFVTWLIQVIGFNPQSTILSSEISHWLPDGFLPLTQSLLSVLNKSDHPTGWALAGLGFAAWSGSSGFSAIIKGLLTAYKVKKQTSFFVIRFRALVLMITFGLIMSAAFSLVSAGEHFLSFLFQFSSGKILITLIQWLTGWLLVFIAVSFLYVFSPSLNLKLKSVLPGSLLFSLSWVLSTWCLNEILDYLIVFKQTLNVLGSTALLMLWMYLTSFLLLTGGEINAILRYPKSKGQTRK
ncbi:MAG: YihY/virulence factor BrkB family protein [Bacteroidetes bacterium]|nr:YihY/virulence factor BrkB family protein [Bacteroidota bacterium]